MINACMSFALVSINSSADKEKDQICKATGEEYTDGSSIPSLVAGANIAGFLKVADAMKAQGDWF